MIKYIIIVLTIAVYSCKPTDVKPTVVRSSIQEAKAQPMPPTIDPSITLDYCMGKFKPKQDERFVPIASKYADRDGMYLRKEAYEAFQKMYDAALKDGVKLVIRSATRNFDYQKGIWERKWSGKTTLSDGVNAAKDIPAEQDRALKILNYSAMPGASRHHWGTDVDFNSFNNSYFESGAGLKIYQWLRAEGHNYGYCQPYTPKESGRSGYNEEKWHWSYTPLSKPLTAFVALHLHDHNFADFMGHQTAKEIEVVKNYVLGVDESCK